MDKTFLHHAIANQDFTFHLNMKLEMNSTQTLKGYLENEEVIKVIKNVIRWTTPISTFTYYDIMKNRLKFLLGFFNLLINFNETFMYFVIVQSIFEVLAREGCV